MNPREVLVIGAGVPGYAVALAVAKRGIPVSIITCPLNRRIYRSSYIKSDNADEYFKNLQANFRRAGCPRAAEQFFMSAKTSLDELSETASFMARDGNIDMYRYLEEQLKLMSNVEWLTSHSVFELLTLDNHSVRTSDLYKKATCLGADVYNHETEKIERLLAKETILAIGGSPALFVNSKSEWNPQGSGLAMAHQAGARLLNLDRIQFHSLGLYVKDSSSFPLPIDLLREGGVVYSGTNTRLDDMDLEEDLSPLFYKMLLNDSCNHLWLDLTMIDCSGIREKYPLMDLVCLNYGYNIAKDLIPIVPIAGYAGAGVHVDLTCQTTVRRLRAIGEVACTGLSYDFMDEFTGISESLTWAVACADDISKQLSRFVYYFPELSERNDSIDVSFRVAQENWHMFRQIMWHYVGITRDEGRLRCGFALLQKLKASCLSEQEQFLSFDCLYFNRALDSAMMIAQAALEGFKNKQKQSCQFLSDQRPSLSY